MSQNDYRARRGLLPPMRQSPKSSPEAEIKDHNSSPKTKHRQLAPLDSKASSSTSAGETFDMEKHHKRNRKLTQMSNRASTLRLK